MERPHHRRLLQKHKKSKFTSEEDAQLIELVKTYGTSDWNKIAQKMNGRNTRQCRERWRHYLTPEVANHPFSPEEDALLQLKFDELGSQWKLMTNFFKGRTDIAIKNRWLLLNRRRMRQEPLEDPPRRESKQIAVQKPPEYSEETAPPPQVEPEPEPPKPSYELKDIEWEEEDKSADDYSCFVGTPTDLSTDYFCLGFTY